MNVINAAQNEVGSTDTDDVKFTSACELTEPGLLSDSIDNVRCKSYKSIANNYQIMLAILLHDPHIVSYLNGH